MITKMRQYLISHMQINRSTEMCPVYINTCTLNQKSLAQVLNFTIQYIQNTPWFSFVPLNINWRCTFPYIKHGGYHHCLVILVFALLIFSGNHDSYTEQSKYTWWKIVLHFLNLRPFLAKITFQLFFLVWNNYNFIFEESEIYQIKKKNSSTIF